MKRIFTTLTFAFGVLSVTQATTPSGYLTPLPGAPKSDKTMFVSGINSDQSPRKDLKASSKGFLNRRGEDLSVKSRRVEKANQKMVNVTLTFPAIGEEGEWSIPWSTVKFYNDNGYYEEVEIMAYDEDWNPITVSSWEGQLPEGTVDVFTLFRHKNPEQLFGFDHDSYYIIENAEIKEGAVLELRPQDSNICLAMQPTLPGGKKVEYLKLSYDEDWNYEYLSEANIADDSMDKLIFYKGMNIENLSTNAGGVEVVPGPQGTHNPYNWMNFYVNEVSDNYLFRVIHKMMAWPDTENGIYCAVTETKGSKEGTYTNGDYILADGNIIPTPANAEYPVKDMYGMDMYPYSFSLWPDGFGIGGGFRSKEKNVWKLWHSRPANPIDKNDQYYHINLVLGDIMLVNEQEGYALVSDITGSDYFPFAEEGLTYCQFGHGFINFQPDGYQPDALYPGYGPYEALGSRMLIEAGGSAPLLTSYVYSMQDWETSEMINFITGYYTGRAGEQIDSDIDLCKASLKADGKEVATDFGTAQDWMIANQGFTGKYEMEITTDNFRIDGIEGGNKAIVNYAAGGNDNIPPSFTFLQFRNLEGDVTQTFEQADKGLILLNAADFTLRESEPSEEGWKYAYCDFSTPAKVTAFVKPTGAMTEDLGEEIELTENPDLFKAPGFGAFYSGSLNKVTSRSDSGWFDLTLTVEDAAGNFQTQTLSPAFKIGNLTNSINNVVLEGVKVMGHDLIVPIGAAVYNTNGLRVTPSDLPSGIYFVTLNGKTIKVSIR